MFTVFLPLYIIDQVIFEIGLLLNTVRMNWHFYIYIYIPILFVYLFEIKYWLNLSKNFRYICENELKYNTYYYYTYVLKITKFSPKIHVILKQILVILSK